MADKPTTSRVGRPRSRSASQTPNPYKNQKLKGLVRKLPPLLREQLDQYYNLNRAQYR